MTAPQSPTGDAPLPCRSTSPDGTPCAAPRGHKKMTHSAPNAQARWLDGVNRPARWAPPPVVVKGEYQGPGDMSEGEYQAYGRFGY